MISLVILPIAMVCPWSLYDWSVNELSRTKVYVSRDLPEREATKLGVVFEALNAKSTSCASNGESRND